MYNLLDPYAEMLKKISIYTEKTLVSTANTAYEKYQLSKDFVTEEDLKKVLLQSLETVMYDIRQIVDNALEIEKQIGQFDNEHKSKHAFQNSTLNEACDIKIVIDDVSNTVCCRMPYPSRTKNNSIRGYKTPYISELRQTVYNISVMAPVHYDNKDVIIHFVHVYSKKEASLARDNDNYEYKEIIDIIADAFGFDDNGARCGLVCETIITDSLREGTYAILSCKPENVALGDKIIKLLQCFQ